MSLSSLLRHEVDWHRPNVSMDASRGAVRDFETVEEGLPCLVQPASAHDKLLFRQRNITLTHKIYFDHALTLKPGDRLYTEQPSPRHFVITGWLDMGGQDGRTFCVEAYEVML